MAAALGQTTNPKDLIPGEPELIASDLRELVGNIQRMSGIKENLSERLRSWGWPGVAGA